MKKHDEGYILAYVFVILVVICLIAVSVLSIPLTNLKVQKASVQEMQDRYTAQGMIEETLAEVTDSIKMFRTMNSSLTSETDAKKGITDRLVTTVDGVAIESPVWTGTDAFSCAFTVTAESGSVKITCEIVLKDVIKELGSYMINVPTIAYNTYQISDAAEGGAGNAA